MSVILRVNLSRANMRNKWKDWQNKQREEAEMRLWAEKKSDSSKKRISPRRSSGTPKKTHIHQVVIVIVMMIVSRCGREKKAIKEKDR